MNSANLQMYGRPTDENISNATRIYGLSVFLFLFALIQWTLIGIFSGWRTFKFSQPHYGYWLLGTFFGICVLSCTYCGRKHPYNIICIAIIFETSTLFIAFEQQNSKGYLVNIYAVIIIAVLVINCIVFAAYFPMKFVPGELALSITVAASIVILAIFFINAYVFQKNVIYSIVRNYFAFSALIVIMYAATIIHDRQFNVPQNEYLFLSVLIFFGHMILHERVLALTSQKADYECKDFNKLI